MAKYSRFKYSQAYYGAVPSSLEYTVAPLTAFVYDYTPENGRVLLQWEQPSGNFNQFRIVRNQDAFPETAEDGVIIYDKFGTVEEVATEDLNYADYPAFSSGRYSYYRAWLRKADHAWYPAGDAYVLIPKTHSTKTSRETRRASISEGVPYQVVSAAISDGVATLTLDMDVTTSQLSGLPTYLRVGSDVRVYGVGTPFNGIFEITDIGYKTFSFDLAEADQAELAVAGWVILYPLENQSEGTHTSDEYSNVELLTTHEKLVDLLPKVYTSISESPIDDFDSSSAIYRFLGGFAPTLDESLTFVDLLKPQHNQRSANPTTLELAAHQYGLVPEPTFATKSQKRMIRESRFMNSRKGTNLALGTMVESVTGWAPDVSVSQNLFLTNQDSTFNKSVGNWVVEGDAVLTYVDANEEGIPLPSTEALSIDNTYCAKVVVTTASAVIQNGEGSPVTRGIPVQEGVTYTFQYYVKGAGAVRASITWYDIFGNAISTDNGDWVTATSTWALDSSASFVAPEFTDTPSVVYGASYATVSFEFDDAATFYLDMLQFAAGGERSYEEARAVTVLVSPAKANHIKNPSFENWTGATLNNWTITGGTGTKVAATLAESYGESYMLSLDTNAGAVEVSTTTAAGELLVNTFYTFSVYLQCPSGNEAVSLKLEADDGDLNFAVTSDPFTVTSEWSRHYVTLRVSGDFDVVGLDLTASILSTSSGNVINIDNAQIENSYYPSDYFDGSLGYYHGALWDGEDHASASWLYPNRIIKIPRLIAEMPNYLPINTPFVIKTLTGVEQKSFT